MESLLQPLLLVKYPITTFIKLVRDLWEALNWAVSRFILARLFIDLINLGNWCIS